MSNPFEHLNPETIEQPEHQEKNTAKSFAENAACSFVYSFAQSPVNGVAQLANHITNTKLLPQCHLVDAPTQSNAYTSDWAAQQLGGGLATVCQFAAAGYLFSKVGGAAKVAQTEGLVAETTTLSTRGQMLLGATYGGVLTPVNDNDNFAGERVKNAVAGALTFGAMERVGVGFKKLGESSMPVVSTVLKNQAATSLLSGATVGTVNADIDSYVRTGHAASGQERVQSALSFALISGAMAGGVRIRETIERHSDVLPSDLNTNNALHVQFENPNLKTPVVLLLDDGAPRINPRWYHLHDINHVESPPDVKEIPFDFIHQWGDTVQQKGIKGAFTITPNPAGLGEITGSVAGSDPVCVRGWLEVAHQQVAPNMDIHPELMTHTFAVDLDHKGNLLPLNERQWMEQADEPALQRYFAKSLQILKDAGVPANGLTTPWGYSGNQQMFAHALVKAEEAVNGRKVVNYFIDGNDKATKVPPVLMHLNAKKGEAVVSIFSASHDYLREATVDGSEPEAVADKYITDKGDAGRLVDLLNGGGPVTMHSHWQFLYSNGTGKGLKAIELVADRLQKNFGDRMQWRKTSELSNDFLVSTTTKIESSVNAKAAKITLESPFSTDLATVSVPLPWRVDSLKPGELATALKIDGKPALHVADAKSLTANSWFNDGDKITVSLPLTARHRTQLTIDRPTEPLSH